MFILCLLANMFSYWYNIIMFKSVFKMFILNDLKITVTVLV